MVDETSASPPPLRLADLGKALVQRAKRQELIGLLFQMPKEALPEALETLVDIHKFYKEDADARSGIA